MGVNPRTRDPHKVFFRRPKCVCCTKLRSFRCALLRSAGRSATVTRARAESANPTVRSQIAWVTDGFVRNLLNAADEGYGNGGFERKRAAVRAV